MCDFVYVLLLAQLREQSNMQQQSFYLARVMGAEVEPPPTLDEAIARLDEALSAPLHAGDDPNRQLREALGLDGR